MAVELQIGDCRLIHADCMDDIVVDPFMGSATTGIACINEGRVFIGIERDAAYFDVACERIRQALRAKKSELFS